MVNSSLMESQIRLLRQDRNPWIERGWSSEPAVLRYSPGLDDRTVTWIHVLSSRWDPNGQAWSPVSQLQYRRRQTTGNAFPDCAAVAPLGA